MRFLFPLLLVLAACDAQFTDPVDFDGQPRCGAEDYYSLLGQNASVLNRIDLPKASRVLRPDDVITMDFSPDRLTIDIDQSNLIASVTCR